ncbi:MAG: efflux RND transporter periplasmic adaptor subunit [Verrucomicrobia bacterium]|nr:efflux RND transporter periplasmic adaptor subunit [Verrucomicrobiota bacterium]
MITTSHNTSRGGETFGRWQASGSLARAAFPAALLTMVFLSGCKKPAAAALPPPIVEYLEIKTSEVPLTATLIGQLDSPQNVEVRARVEAFVKDAPFMEGKEVAKDQVIFVLDEEPYKERLKAAEGSLAEAKAAVAKNRADVARLEPLFESHAIPEQDLDNAKAAVEVGDAGVQSAEARVDAAKLDIRYCTVRAPITGMIGAKQVSIGDLVGKGQPTLLATISDQQKIWFYCNVSEVDYMQAEEKSGKRGTALDTLPLTLILPTGVEHPHIGHLVFSDRAVDVKTGTLRLRAEFDNPEKNLKPGMFARVRVDLGIRKDCLEVPERAVVELQGKTFLWVLNDGKANQVSVTVGEQNGSNFLILEGLKPGDRVVVEGIQKLREDLPVNAKTAAEMAAMKAAAAAEPKPAKE